ncbi:MAG: electron transport complex subunit RsxC [Arenimonas sp.]|nr:electron transport complex subunit RsxC [Arenimonas sp.]
MRLHSFPGGLSLPGNKAPSTAQGLQHCALPAELRLPLLQHAGRPALACVSVGERVQRGQPVARADGAVSAAVHSPCAGVVEAIQAVASARLAGAPVAHVVVRVEAEGDLTPLAAFDWQTADPDDLRSRIREAGVVGLGGAGYPTAEKLAVGRELLVLNGAECEPWIACDDALLREHADEVVRGGCLMARAVGATRVLLAIEDSMTQALAAARAAAADHGNDAVQVVAVPTKYPQGGERQLIQTLTGREVPRGGLPRDLGVLVHNVGTARAAWRAVAAGEPLMARVVTVTGGGVARPGNYWVPLGTTVAHLVAQAGGYRADAARLLLGGPMMGLALADDDVALGKQDNCVLVLARHELPDARTELPCIRCGACADACPSRLLPQQLLWHARSDQPARGEAQGLFDCIECGACDLACPSAIPLTATFRRAKRQLRDAAAASEQALAARQRFEARQQRLERLAAERAQRHEARKADAASPDAVAAALERARAKRAAPP